MSARGRVCLYGHGGYSSDMSVRGHVCLRAVMVDAALTCVRVDMCASKWSWWKQLRHKCAWTRVLNSGHGGYSSDMSARGRACLTVVMVDTALT